VKKKRNEPVRTNAVIYCRVSTDEQVENLSLSTQRERSISFCSQNGWGVVRIFVDEGKSAKTTQRAAFQQMLTFCQDAKNAIGYVVVHDLSRFSRSNLDQQVTRASLLAAGVLLRSVSEMIDETAFGMLTSGMTGVFNEFDNNRKRERTVIGMQKAASLGRFPFAAPLGYINILGSREGPNLGPDPKTAKFVQKAFELAAEGIHTKAEILRTLNGLGLQTKRGLPLSAQTFQKMLLNPIYAGWVVIPKWEIKVRGTFEPLIDQDQYERVQDVLAGRQPSLTSYQRNNPDFPLRLFVRCGSCGVPLTGSWSKGRREKYPYYRCRKPACLAVKIRQESLESEFVRLLEYLTPEATLMPVLKEKIRSVWKQRKGDAHAIHDLKNQKLSQVTSRKSTLIDRWMDGQVDQKIYEETLARYNSEILDAERERRSAEFEYLDLEGVLVFAERLIRRPARLWLESSLDQKQKLQKTFFPSGLSFDGAQFGTASTPLFFNLLAGFSEQDDDVASPTGFEPVLSP
jgi:site-specific DNA recombinase